jgi:hypothetical protein
VGAWRARACYSALAAPLIRWCHLVPDDLPSPVPIDLPSPVHFHVMLMSLRHVACIPRSRAMIQAIFKSLSQTQRFLLVVLKKLLNDSWRFYILYFEQSKTIDTELVRLRSTFISIIESPNPLQLLQHSLRRAQCGAIIMIGVSSLIARA